MNEKIRNIRREKRGNLVEETIKLASENGFSFTEEDYNEMLKKQIEARHAAIGLTEEQLKKAAHRGTTSLCTSWDCGVTWDCYGDYTEW